MDNQFLNSIIAVFGSTLRLATPLIFASMGGIFSEKSGVINIGLEGMMITGAFFAVWGTHITGNPWFGIVFSVIFAILVSVIHAVLSIFLRANQVVSGVAINLFAGAITNYLIQQLFNSQGQTSIVTLLPFPKDFLRNIPLIGPFLAELNWFVIFAFLLVIITWFILYRTPVGLRIRSVGEHPRAADTLGINVYLTRFLCVVISGALAGIGGASLSIGNINLFRSGMVNGRGFIAIAAMIFGNWKPGATLIACLLFAFSQAFEILAQKFALNIPLNFYYAFPYVFTILALVLFVKKSNSPKSLGEFYVKNNR